MHVFWCAYIGLIQYQDIAQAVRQGKLDAYDQVSPFSIFQNEQSVTAQAMTEHQQLFVQRGVYLILEKAKILAFRNFFKRMWDEFMIKIVYSRLFALN